MTLIKHNQHTSRILSIIIALTLFVSSQTSNSKEQSQQPPRSFALLIGISDYYQLGRRPWPKLNTGQELDTLREILISKWRFSSDDILTLKDNSATKQNIISSFRHHLIEKVKPGDIVFFHFSGHGQQIPDDNDDEMDGLDESIVPYDAIDRSVAAGAKTNIRDDELGILFRELAERLQAGTRRPGSITVSLDSCFSGTATRGILIERGGPWDVSLDGPKPRPFPRGQMDGPTGLFAAGEAAHGNYVLLSASRSDQTAHEENGMGVYSRALIHALATSPADHTTTYRTLIDKISVEVSSIVPEQSPQLEGNPDTLLFSGKMKASTLASAGHRVLYDKEGRLRLQAGSIHGITAQSVFSLYPTESTNYDQDSSLGEAEVQQVDPFQATLTLMNGLSLPTHRITKQGIVGIEKVHSYNNEPLRLYWINKSNNIKSQARCSELYKTITTQPVVTTSETNSQQHDVSVLCNERTNKIEVRRASSSTPMIGLPLDQKASESLQQILKDFWRWKHLYRLQQDNPSANVQLRTFPVIVTLDRNGLALERPSPYPNHPPTKHLAEPSNSHFMMELTNTSKNPLYVTILELGSDGSVDVLFPTNKNSTDNLIAADGKPHIPDYRPYVYKIRGPVGQRSLLKLIATRDPIDLSGAIQGSLQRGTDRSGDRTSPLARLLLDLVTGERGATSNPSSQVWGTADAWIEISR